MFKPAKILRKKGFWKVLEILPDQRHIVHENGKNKEVITPIRLVNFFKKLDNYNLFYRDVKDTLLRNNLIEILKENGPRKIRLTERGLALKITLDIIQEKYFREA